MDGERRYVSPSRAPFGPSSVGEWGEGTRALHVSLPPSSRTQAHLLAPPEAAGSKVDAGVGGSGRGWRSRGGARRLLGRSNRGRRGGWRVRPGRPGHSKNCGRGQDGQPGQGAAAGEGRERRRGGQVWRRRVASRGDSLGGAAGRRGLGEGEHLRGRGRPCLWLGRGCGRGLRHARVCAGEGAGAGAGVTWRRRVG